MEFLLKTKAPAKVIPPKETGVIVRSLGVVVGRVAEITPLETVIVMVPALKSAIDNIAGYICY